MSRVPVAQNKNIIGCSSGLSFPTKDIILFIKMDGGSGRLCKTNHHSGQEDVDCTSTYMQTRLTLAVVSVGNE